MLDLSLRLLLRLLWKLEPSPALLSGKGWPERRSLGATSRSARRRGFFTRMIVPVVSASRSLYGERRSRDAPDTSIAAYVCVPCVSPETGRGKEEQLACLQLTLLASELWLLEKGGEVLAEPQRAPPARRLGGHAAGPGPLEAALVDHPQIQRCQAQKDRRVEADPRHRLVLVILLLPVLVPDGGVGRQGVFFIQGLVAGPAVVVVGILRQPLARHRRGAGRHAPGHLPAEDRVTVALAEEWVLAELPGGYHSRHRKCQTVRRLTCGCWHRVALMSLLDVGWKWQI